MAWVAQVRPGGGGCRGDGVAVCCWLAGRRRAADGAPGSRARDHLGSCRRLRAGHVRIFPGIAVPRGITAGPDGALWFTNGRDSIGRITTAGTGSADYHRPRHRQRRSWDHGRAGRGAVVHQLLRQLDRADHHRRGGHQLHRHRHQRPGGDHGRARRCAVVHQHRQQLDRADHHRRGGHQLHRRRHRRPGRDHGGSGRGAVVHQQRQQHDRADHHRRGGHQLTPAPASHDPDGIAAGPDGALWFTNDADATRSGGSPPPGRSPTTPAPASPDPSGIAAGPDGALWFTNPTATARSGGSRPPGRSPATPAPASAARRDRGRAGRGAVVHQHRQRLDRADHHHRGGHQLHRPRHRAARTGSRPGPTGRCGSPTTATTRSGGSPPPATVTNYTGPGISGPGRDRGRARRGAVVHQRRQQLDRADHHHRGGHQLHRHRHQRPAARSRPGPTGRCGSPTTGNNSIGRITTAGAVTNYTGTGIDAPGRDHGRARRCAVVHQHPATTRSGGSPPPGRSPIHRPRHPAAGRDHAGPDGALWFTNDGSSSIGRITTTGTVTIYTTPASPDQPTGSPPARTGRCGSPTLTTTTPGRRGRPDHHHRDGHHLHRRRRRPPVGITAGPDGALWFADHDNNTMGGSPPPLPRRPRSTGRPVTPTAGVTASTDRATDRRQDHGGTPLWSSQNPMIIAGSGMPASSRWAPCGTGALGSHRARVRPPWPTARANLRHPGRRS